MRPTLFALALLLGGAQARGVEVGAGEEQPGLGEPVADRIDLAVVDVETGERIND